MSARETHRELDLYSLQCPPHIGRAIVAALDEIDVLRAKKRADDLVFDAVNSLMRELTAHADAMRDLLANARLRMSDLGNFHIRKQMIEAINAYDEFVKEC